MRDLRELDRYRVARWEAAILGGGILEDEGRRIVGAFSIPSVRDRGPLKVVASGAPESLWDHVSVSRANRCPTWEEMEQIKRLFFLDHETAMQLHVPVAEHINVHPYCLHLWRPMVGAIPMPPAGMVG